MSSIAPVSIIGTTKTFSLVSALIRKREAGIGKMWSPHVASHIICLVPDWLNPGKTIGVEMSPRGIRRVQPGQLPAGEHIVFSANPPMKVPHDGQVYVRRAFDAATKYDFDALLALLGFGRQDSNRLYCSELAAGMLLAGCYSCPPEWKDSVTPWDKQRHFEAAGLIVYRSYKKFWC